MIRIDDSLEPTDVAPLADAGLTAYHAIKKALPLLYPGTTCAVIGAGGLGHIGIQCLRAMSATRIVVLDANPAALALATEWGADETVLVDGEPGRRGAGAHRRAAAPTWSSTSSASPAPRSGASTCSSARATTS